MTDKRKRACKSYNPSCLQRSWLLAKVKATPNESFLLQEKTKCQQKVIGFDCIIPLPAFSKRFSHNGFTFEKNFEVILGGMNSVNTRTICKMPCFEKICLNIKTRDGIDILESLLRSKRGEPNEEGKIDLERFLVFNPFFICSLKLRSPCSNQVRKEAF